MEYERESPFLSFFLSFFLICQNKRGGWELFAFYKELHWSKYLTEPQPHHSSLNAMSIGVALQVYLQGRHWDDGKILLEGHGNKVYAWYLELKSLNILSYMKHSFIWHLCSLTIGSVYYEFKTALVTCLVKLLPQESIRHFKHWPYNCTSETSFSY